MTDLLLPIKINLHQLEINGLEWITDGESQHIQQLALSAFSQGEQIHLQYLDVTALNGVSRLQGEVAWVPELSFDLALETDPLQLQSLSSEWPGVLTAQLSVKGQLHAETLVGVIDIEQIAGRIRDYPLTASVQLTINGRHIETKQLVITSANNRVQVIGFEHRYSCP